jgi:hypothetical protein
VEERALLPVVEAYGGPALERFYELLRQLRTAYQQAAADETLQAQLRGLARTVLYTAAAYAQDGTEQHNLVRSLHKKDATAGHWLNQKLRERVVEWSKLKQETRVLQQQLQASELRNSKLSGELVRIKDDRPIRDVSLPPKLTLTPPLYGGKLEDLGAWICKVEQAAMFQHVGEQYQTAFAMNFLEAGVHQEIWTWVKNIGERDYKDNGNSVPWELFRDYMQARFSDDEKIEEYLRLMTLSGNGISQKGDESFRDYYHRFCLVVSYLDSHKGGGWSSSRPAGELAKIFRIGLLDPKLKESLAFKNRDTLEEETSLPHMFQKGQTLLAANPGIYTNPRSRNYPTMKERQEGFRKTGDAAKGGGGQKNFKRKNQPGTSTPQSQPQHQQKQQKSQPGSSNSKGGKSKQYCTTCTWTNHTAADCKHKGKPEADLKQIREAAKRFAADPAAYKKQKATDKKTAEQRKGKGQAGKTSRQGNA